MFIHRKILPAFSLIVILSILFSSASLSPVSAQEEDDLERNTNAQTGKISFIGPESGVILPAMEALGISRFSRPQDPGMALAKRFGPEFGLKNPARDLRLKSSHSDRGRMTFRYQQMYQGIPVMGGELIVNTNENGDLYSINGEVSLEPSLLTQPAIDPEQARQTALQEIANSYQKVADDFVSSTPELWIYDESLLRSSARPAELVWRMEVTPKDIGMPVRELVMVNAQSGGLSLHFNQVDTSWKAFDNVRTQSTTQRSEMGDYAVSVNSPARHITAQTATPPVSTYTAQNTSTLPGTFLCDQTAPTCPLGNIYAKAAHKHALGTYNLYFTQFNRDSIDNSGMTIVSTVDYCDERCPYDNAAWIGDQVIYGSANNYALADDIVAHELTHGVTQYESTLFYYYQSGAIDESFADLWGEYYDQTNGQDIESGVMWEIGEDVSDELDSFRSMSAPPVFGDPDRMTSNYYYTGIDDSGGVHTNSGVNNKAAYLMVAGGTFNGKTIPALGWDKTTAIYYKVSTDLLTSGADYSDLYYALQSACSSLRVSGRVTDADCTAVKDAIDAVEMNLQPVADFNTDAPYCDTDDPVATVFSDDLESGTGNWTFINGLITRWQLDSERHGPYAHSGLHSLYANDRQESVTDAIAQLIPVAVPGNTYLHFAHAYEFQADRPTYYDGGVLEYSADGGPWTDAGAFMDYNGYKGNVSADTGNPLASRPAFVGASHGYISTRVNLFSLAGQTIRFRWRMGLNPSGYAEGWWIDDVRIYQCASVPMITVQISGSELKSYPLIRNGSTRASFASLDGGPVKIMSSDGIPLIASERINLLHHPTTSSYTEIMGLPATRVTDTYLFPWYNNVGLDSQLRFANVGSANTTVTVKVGGITRGSYPLLPNQSWRQAFANVDAGPVEIKSSGGVPIVASLRINLLNHPTTSSYTELMGLLGSSAAGTRYVFPWYNNVGLDSQLRFANVGSANTIVTVKIGGMERGSYPLRPNQSLRQAFEGVDAGPVEVTSSGGVPIIASERVNLLHHPSVSSYSELMGLPGTTVTHTRYLFPWYNNVGLDSQLRFANVGSANTTVTVRIGGTVRGSYVLAPNQSWRQAFDGVDAGPVEVESSGGVPIIASLRINLLHHPSVSSYSELMGLSVGAPYGWPGNQLSDTYWFPWYNNVGLDSQLRFGVP